MDATRSEVGTLRDAARLMRDRASTATGGPWWSHETDQCWTLHGVATRLPAFWDGGPEQVVGKQILKAPKFGTTQAEYWPNAADSAHMVPMMNPVLALAIADWLDGEADLHESASRAEGKVPEGWRLRVTSSTLPQAVAVARAYLDGSA